MSTVETLMDRLRRQTEEHHRKIEALPFFGALMAGSLPVRSYVGLLKAMAVINGVLESVMSRSTHPVLTSIWREDMRKLPLLHDDLASFEGHCSGDIIPATERTLDLAATVRDWDTAKPIALLGCLYVVEGSMLGAKVLRHKLAQLIAPRRQTGLAYVSKYDAAVADHWRDFSQRMNAVRLDQKACQAIVDGACGTFEGIDRIVAALYPFEEGPTRYHAAALNPDAGMHPIAYDPRELLAALDAGERSWDAYPYFEWRYGERGKRFTRSDSAWLVTLSDMKPAIVEQQVRWLGRLLSVRGMPQLLLEHHLRNLHEALVRAVPERQHRYDKLGEAAGGLGAIRRQHIDDHTFHSLSDEFDKRVGGSWSARLKNTGRILASAVADEKAGIDQAVESLEGWMTDPSRFPERWVSAVRYVLGKARATQPRV